jgi:hypothetical protein
MVEDIKITLNGHPAHELMARMKLEKAMKLSRQKVVSRCHGIVNSIDQWFVTQAHTR